MNHNNQAMEASLALANLAYHLKDIDNLNRPQLKQIISTLDTAVTVTHNLSNSLQILQIQLMEELTLKEIDDMTGGNQCEPG